MKHIMTIIVGFVHDFSAGLWAASVLAVFWLERELGGVDAEAGGEVVAAALQGLQRQFFWVGVACVVLVMATGAGRTFTYVEGFYGEDAEKARRKTLIVKHVVLLTVFGLGTWWQWAMAFR